MADQPNDAFSEESKNTNTEENQNPQSSGNPASQESSADNFKDHLKTIVNEDGKPKYDSVEKALEALNHSQRYIPELKTELEQKNEELERVKAELEKRESVEDVVKRLKSDDSQPRQQAQEEQPEVSGLDEQSAKQLFEQMLEERAQNESFQQNRNKVNTTLAERYGEKSKEVVQKKAEELGTTPKELGDLASRNPNMVLALFDSSGSSKGPSPTTSSINSQLNPPNQPELKKPDKSMLAGATSKEQAELMRQIKEDVYRRYGVET